MFYKVQTVGQQRLDVVVAVEEIMVSFNNLPLPSGYHGTSPPLINTLPTSVGMNIL
jgi:hypothetical protein